MSKDKLGKKYVCYKCGCKFYDLQRAQPTCPKCGADQNEAPKRDLPSLGRIGTAAASARQKLRKRREEAFESEPNILDEPEADHDLGEGLSLVEEDDILDVVDDDFQDET
ncbi:MAG: FYDLN acid domain-containing protein [bacterium]